MKRSKSPLESPYLRQALTKKVDYDKEYQNSFSRDELSYTFLDELQGFIQKNSMDGLELKLEDNQIKISIVPQKALDKEKQAHQEEDHPLKTLDSAFHKVVGEFEKMGLGMRLSHELLNRYQAYLRATGLDKICSNKSGSNNAFNYIAPSRNHAF